MHLSHLGNPILGDTLYGVSSPYISRQALHAYKMQFIHPITKESVIIIAPIAEDIRQVMNINTLATRKLQSKIFDNFPII